MRTNLQNYLMFYLMILQLLHLSLMVLISAEMILLYLSISIASNSGIERIIHGGDRGAIGCAKQSRAIFRNLQDFTKVVGCTDNNFLHYRYCRHHARQ